MSPLAISLIDKGPDKQKFCSQFYQYPKKKNFIATCQVDKYLCCIEYLASSQFDKMLLNYQHLDVCQLLKKSLLTPSIFQCENIKAENNPSCSFLSIWQKSWGHANKLSTFGCLSTWQKDLLTPSILQCKNIKGEGKNYLAFCQLDKKL